MENDGETAEDCVRRIGWTKRGFADKIGVHETRVRRMFKNQAPIDPEMLRRLQNLARFHDLNPIGRAGVLPEPEIGPTTQVSPADGAR